MAIENKTLAMHIQDAYQEGIEQGMWAQRYASSNAAEYNVGLEVTKALYQLREEIAQELLAIAKQNESYILPIEVAVGTALNRPMPEAWRIKYGN